MAKFLISHTIVKQYVETNDKCVADLTFTLVYCMKFQDQLVMNSSGGFKFAIMPCSITPVSVFMHVTTYITPRECSSSG